MTSSRFGTVTWLALAALGCGKAAETAPDGGDAAAGSANGQSTEAGTSSNLEPTDAAVATDAMTAAAADTMPPDLPAPASCKGTITYRSPASASNWTTIAAAPPSSSWKLQGSTFDGRYLYLMGNGFVTRFDTRAPFDSASAWLSADIFGLEGWNSVGRGGSSGAAFDGRFVYALVDVDGGPFNHGIVRYDSHEPFGATSSWSIFDAGSLHAVSASDTNFTGMTFDGRYLYFPPSTFGTNPPAALRFDTTADFADESSWSTFATPTNKQYTGAVFDGRYVYLLGDAVSRYDTKAPFTSSSSWTTYQFVTSAGGGQFGSAFFGGAFDGRYVYLVGSTIGRYDTQAPFTEAGSWSAFAPTPSGTYGTATYDGRYLYFGDEDPQAQGAFLSFDTQADFLDASAWQRFNPFAPNGAHSVGSAAPSFTNFGIGSTSTGLAFDGAHVYAFAALGVLDPTRIPMAQFTSHDCAAMPPLPGYYGSFY